MPGKGSLRSHVTHRWSSSLLRAGGAFDEGLSEVPILLSRFAVLTATCRSVRRSEGTPSHS